MLTCIDTHTHLDGTEYDADRDEVIARAAEAGVTRMFVPAIDRASSLAARSLAGRYPGRIYSMAGLHPEEVKADYAAQLAEIKPLLPGPFIAVGEVGLDFYWSREFESEQLAAFEEQVRWSVEYRLPLMIHCRKAQNEMVALLRRYEKELPGGVFHCFTGNEKEAAELLRFDRFVLGIGGVLTFKKSNLPSVLPSVPLERIVLETDSPYMAPVPMRGQRNESAYVRYVLSRMAGCYGVSEERVAEVTTATAETLFGI